MIEKEQAPPSWAASAVWYQIFPERFRNGCPDSNPRAKDLKHAVPEAWTVAPWGHDWYARLPWETCDRDVYNRRFGGDLVGVKQKLDYLQELGVTAIYLNPVFQSPSLHKYDASTFHHVDPTLGPDRAGDLQLLAEAVETEDPSTWIWTAADRLLLDLIKDVHVRGMRIILDGVFNHTGRDFFACRDLLKNGKASRYRAWYRVEEWLPDGTPRLKGWFDHRSLPELAREKDQLAEPVRQYIFDITSRWMQPVVEGVTREGIDGWRLDVAYCVPHGFWKAWRKHVRALNPEAYLTGEIVHCAPEYVGDEFDALMNYSWLYPAVAFFKPGSGKTASRTKATLTRVRHAYPWTHTLAMQNLLDSHDVGRILSMLENAAVDVPNWEHYFHASRVRSGATEFNTCRPGDEARQVLRQLMIFQMTYPGAPMLYYGTEWGLWGANDPDNRKPMLWDDLPAEDEAHTLQGPCPAQSCARDQGLFAFTKAAIALRKNHAALQSGDFSWFRTPHPRMLSYERTLADSCIRVFLHAGAEPCSDVRIGKGTILSCWGVDVSKTSATFQPHAWLVLERI